MAVPPPALFQKRDAKVKPHLTQYAPAWIVEETYLPSDEALLFNVVFEHSQYGWVNRRYLYDGFNNVLYHKGQVAASDELVMSLVNKEPYITPDIADIPNAYGG
ncbi:MAG: hypothetical protein MUC99_11470 [Anaerolineae bacterium]|jgi:hypothetical protein|nr:hypothetical protein [Anaerolineae bacterium]